MQRNKRLPQAHVGIELVVRYIFLHFLCFAAIDAAYDFFPAHDETGHETYKIIDASTPLGSSQSYSL